MKTHAVIQGTEEWFKLRMGIPTASEFSNLVTPGWKVRTGEMPATYLATKLAERWIGRPLPSFSGGAMEQGSIREEEAVPWYEAEFDTDIERPGFITSDDGRLGCSPDGLIRGTTGIEIKCPEPKSHVKWLLADEVPAEHLAQVYGSMFVTGLEAWQFLSYCRGFPALLKTATWDFEAIEAIDRATSAFLDRLESGWSSLVRINGGGPR